MTRERRCFVPPCLALSARIPARAEEKFLRSSVLPLSVSLKESRVCIASRGKFNRVNVHILSPLRSTQFFGGDVSLRASTPRLPCSGLSNEDAAFLSIQMLNFNSSGEDGRPAKGFVGFWEDLRKLVAPRSSGNSRDNMKRRLKEVIANDRTDLSPDIMTAMQSEILSVVKEYIELESNDIDSALEALSQTSAMRSRVLEVVSRYVELDIADIEFALDLLGLRRTGDTKARLKRKL
eukprot:CAMPEP_0184351136 /NCGR_PEP_ID=MMETSP1089-20130417/43420_1 /TAXON_ID=38269 ORGANISM="Gloeochaete wittrockiana, Strain SAG46.84" /NCGR_SAMPLE_ID=MMETSP1089 /ASSEMBLY_ACC=CAM_ASM_000445 /LENGTH=235 /DNA_ID=CAMNT_0026684385 /DNA_START=22 /DNA_END=729 /DNA_ORIENTATION=+